MSLVAMKKKADAIQFNKISSNGNFNLYGTMRKHSYIQPNIAVSRKGTPHTRNGGPQGHGGVVTNVIDNTSCVCNEETKPITPSVKNTFASHSTRFRYAHRPYPHGTFKIAGQGSMMENYNQSSYIESKKANCVTEDLRFNATNRQTKAEKLKYCSVPHVNKTSKTSLLISSARCRDI